DAQSINLNDLFARGRIEAGGCAGAEPPRSISAAMLAELQLLFTTGKGTSAGATCTANVGATHAPAIGYATIDVVADCAAKNAGSPDYFTTTLLYDNVLTGDYQQLKTTPRPFAFGGPLVHIRAIPEGGPAGAVVPPNSSFLPRPSTSGDTVGWLYLNLNNGGSSAYSVARTPEGVARVFAGARTKVRQSQNWLIGSTSDDSPLFGPLSFDLS